MGNYNIGFEGIEALLNGVVEAGKLDDVKKIVKQDTAFMAKEAAKNTPVDTGYLKRSETPSIKDDGMTGEVTASADYAAYQEYGTRYIYGKFYMKKAQNVAGAQFLKNIERLMK